MKPSSFKSIRQEIAKAIMMWRDIWKKILRPNMPMVLWTNINS
jgi:hypothetical protein